MQSAGYLHLGVGNLASDTAREALYFGSYVRSVQVSSGAQRIWMFEDNEQEMARAAYWESLSRPVSLSMMGHIHAPQYSVLYTSEWEVHALVGSEQTPTGVSSEYSGSKGQPPGDTILRRGLLTFLSFTAIGLLTGLASVGAGVGSFLVGLAIFMLALYLHGSHTKRPILPMPVLLVSGIGCVLLAVSVLVGTIDAAFR